MTRTSGAHRRQQVSTRTFLLVLAAIVVVGAGIRFLYVPSDDRISGFFPIGGDGLSYHLEAQRWADGLGYTSAFGDVGAEIAHHPPAWVTVLGVVTKLGGESLRAHQYVGAIIGLGVIIVAGLVGRRYFGERVGLLAAGIAAVYPGFWVLEAQVLSEPLGLLVLGVFMLVVHGVVERPTAGRAVVVGIVCGVLALVRSEQLALLVLVVLPLLLLRRSVPVRQRLVMAGVAVAATALVIAPWTLHNELRFERTVVLSTNAGSTLLAGNCPPSTYEGERRGFYDISCGRALVERNPGIDRSEVDPLLREEALDNIADNLGELPSTVAARFGRMLGLYDPNQTVGYVAEWFVSERWPVWAWIVSFWVLLPLATAGAIRAFGQRALLLPFVGPVVLVVLLVAVTYGEPRYHTPADLGLVVLAAVALDRVLPRGRPAARGAA